MLMSNRLEKNGKQASRHDGMTPGGASALTMFMMFVVFLPLAWFLLVAFNFSFEDLANFSVGKN